jgi:hypothetical protein
MVVVHTAVAEEDTVVVVAGEDTVDLTAAVVGKLYGTIGLQENVTSGAHF